MNEKRSILVAEDDVTLRDLIVGVLRADGHEVSEAESTDVLGAMLRAKAHGSDGLVDAYDLIVTDNIMPNGHAIELLAELRRHGMLTPMIMMTAFPDAEVRRKAAALHIMVVPKPLSLQALRFAVDYTLLGLEQTKSRQA